MMNHTTPRSDVKRTAFTPKKSASIATSFSFGLLSTALLLTSLSAQDTSSMSMPVGVKRKSVEEVVF